MVILFLFLRVVTCSEDKKLKRKIIDDFAVFHFILLVSVLYQYNLRFFI